MGHYDSCYESTERQEKRIQRENLIRWISELDFDGMSLEELTLLYHVAGHIEDFAGMQRFLRSLNGL